jgi:NAD+-processing family protein with receiver domain
MLQEGGVEALSLDHDLGEDDLGRLRPDGYSVATRLEQLVVTDDSFTPPDVMLCYSSNPVGKSRIEQVFESIRRTASMRSD